MGELEQAIESVRAMCGGRGLNLVGSRQALEALSIDMNATSYLGCRVVMLCHASPDMIWILPEPEEEQ